MSLQTPLIIPAGLFITQDQILPFCEKYHIISFEFFGSASRGTLRPDSDIDIMVRYEQGSHPGFFEHLQMVDEMTEIFKRKVDIADRDQIAKSQNYIRRIGMLNNLLPTHRQISYLLDILLCIRDLQKFSVLNSRLSDYPTLRDIRHDARLYELTRISGIAKLVAPEMRAAIPSVPWELLDKIEGMDILDEPDPALVDEISNRLRASEQDLLSVIPDEETFTIKIREKGFW